MRRGGESGLLLAFGPAELPLASNEEDHLPTVVALLIVRGGPAGHAGQTNPVSNDVANFPIGEVLRAGEPQVGRFWIQVAADGGLPRAVRAVATRAARQKAFASLL